MNPTELLYMNDQYAYDATATVLDVQQDEQGRTFLILDCTVFYPQGGGQAWDTGRITTPQAVFTVQEVRFFDGYVHHYGTFTEGEIKTGETVSLHVDEARRKLNSRLHSAGHLLDEAVRNLGLNWEPTKGIHYPGQAAVEYRGELTASADEIKNKIEAEINRLVMLGFKTRAEMASAANIAEKSWFVPNNMPADKPMRVVTILGDKGVPCGGTHVADISEIGPITVRYVKAKKGDIKVAYEFTVSTPPVAPHRVRSL